MINRRDALQRLALLTGGFAILPQWAGAIEQWQTGTFHSEALVGSETASLLAEIAEMIIPTTDTPGAKAAKVEEFIMLIMQDCTGEADRQRFYAGLEAFEAGCKKTYSKGFVALEKPERIEALKAAEAETSTEKGKPTFFRTMKGLTMTGYFTSEIGATQALEYIHVPGEYHGCVPMEKGQRASGAI